MSTYEAWDRLCRSYLQLARQIEIHEQIEAELGEEIAAVYAREDANLERALDHSVRLYSRIGELQQQRDELQKRNTELVEENRKLQEALAYEHDRCSVPIRVFDIR